MADIELPRMNQAVSKLTGAGSSMSWLRFPSFFYQSWRLPACLGSAGAGLGARTDRKVDGQIDPSLMRRALVVWTNITTASATGILSASTTSPFPRRAPRFNLVKTSPTADVARNWLPCRGSDPAPFQRMARPLTPRVHSTTRPPPERIDGFFYGCPRRAMRLGGTDPTNSNALSRAIGGMVPGT